MNKTIVVAGITLSVLGELSPAEEVWLAENSRRKQLESMKNRYSVVKALAQSKHIQGKVEDEEEAELLALTIMQTNAAEQAPQDKAALELVYLKMVDTKAYPEEPKDDELEFLTFIVQNRSNQKSWTYEKTRLLGTEKQQALWGFINSEIVGGTSTELALEQVIDPLEPNSEASAEPPIASPGMSAITG